MSNHNKFDVNKFNKFLDSASKAIECGTECQRNKKKEDLKNKYLTAESNLDLAEPQYQVAKKNYYTYVSGQSGYNDMMEREYTEQAELFVSEFTENYEEELENVNTEINSYSGILVNFRNIVELYKKYKEDNYKLFKELKDQSNDVLTNDRKTYYEDQNIGVLNVYYYYFLWTIYIVILVCYAVFSLKYPSPYSYKVRILIFIVLFILPFISTWLLGKFIALSHLAYGLLPKNVYV